MYCSDMTYTKARRKTLWEQGCSIKTEEMHMRYGTSDGQKYSAMTAFSRRYQTGAEVSTNAIHEKE